MLDDCDQTFPCFSVSQIPLRDSGNILFLQNLDISKSKNNRKVSKRIDIRQDNKDFYVLFLKNLVQVIVWMNKPESSLLKSLTAVAVSCIPQILSCFFLIADSLCKTNESAFLNNIAKSFIQAKKLHFQITSLIAKSLIQAKKWLGHQTKLKKSSSWPYKLICSTLIF